jgi:hypothetical protein
MDLIFCELENINIFFIIIIKTWGLLAYKCRTLTDYKEKETNLNSISIYLALSILPVFDAIYCLNLNEPSFVLNTSPWESDTRFSIRLPFKNNGKVSDE